MDKTALLQKLVAEGNAYFLARPRRFGKSLTISTLHAMLTGNATLFDGLAAFPWVTKQSQQKGRFRVLHKNFWAATRCGRFLDANATLSRPASDFRKMLRFQHSFTPKILALIP